jgi:hypothetical protein
MSEDLRRCVDGPDCQGTVRLRAPIGIPTPVPRCDRHWEQRLEEQRRFEARYCTHVPVADVAPIRHKLVNPAA